MRRADTCLLPAIRKLGVMPQMRHCIKVPSFSRRYQKSRTESLRFAPRQVENSAFTLAAIVCVRISPSDQSAGGARRAAQASVFVIQEKLWTTSVPHGAAISVFSWLPSVRPSGWATSGASPTRWATAGALRSSSYIWFWRQSWASRFCCANSRSAAAPARDASAHTTGSQAASSHGSAGSADCRPSSS